MGKHLLDAGEVATRESSSLLKAAVNEVVSETHLSLGSQGYGRPWER